jgi:hypothetical protein
VAGWAEFAEAEPNLAAFGAQRFAATDVAYLATIAEDGHPRVHPVTPIIGQGRLFLFMEPTSAKGHDLRRDGRYALHSSVSDPDGTSGEFTIRGRAAPVEDATVRTLAATAASYEPAERYALFELSVESAHSTAYEQGKPVRRRWEG